MSILSGIKFPKFGKGTALLAILFILGIIFLFLSEYISNSKIQENEIAAFDNDSYAESLEVRLEGIIGKISGVENVSVMVTLEGSAIYTYAEETVKSSGTGTDQSESSLLLQQASDGAKTPILTFAGAPAVKGVSVVCKGGGKAEIQAKIISLISSTLNLNKNRIYVTE